MKSYLETGELGQLLLDLAEEIAVPPSKYEEATGHYDAVGKWLDGEDGQIARYKPSIYPQGSFALGTAVKPIGDGHYDVDAVCLLETPPRDLDQKQLKELVGKRLADSAIYKKMLQPEGRRCWTLNYADASKFHLDVLPAIPHTHLGHSEAIHITDNQRPRDFWGDSNPKGYQAWFKDRMKVVFQARREAAALAKSASVEEIPDYDVRTPLQYLIQILKRHRDLHFGQDEDKPISIIITTLAARAYDNEPDLYQAMVKVIPGMRLHIQESKGASFIPNPVIPAENFADKWQENPRKRTVFHDWLNRVEAFGRELATASSESNLRGILVRSFGEDLASTTLGKVASRRVAPKTGGMAARPQKPFSSGVLMPRFLKWLPQFSVPHRVQPEWLAGEERAIQLRAQIIGGTGSGQSIQNGAAISVGCRIQFEVVDRTDGSESVYWQVVNTGREAEAKGDLRGGILPTGSRRHEESARYVGSHWVECFFVKTNRDGLMECTARSGEFVVHIR